MSGGCWELVTSNEPTILAEPLLDTIMMEDSKSDGRFADSANTNESGWGETFCQGNDLFDQIITSETGSRRRGR